MHVKGQGEACYNSGLPQQFTCIAPLVQVKAAQKLCIELGQGLVLRFLEVNQKESTSRTRMNFISAQTVAYVLNPVPTSVSSFTEVNGPLLFY